MTAWCGRVHWATQQSGFPARVGAAAARPARATVHHGSLALLALKAWLGPPRAWAWALALTLGLMSVGARRLRGESNGGDGALVQVRSGQTSKIKVGWSC
ncbi:hypothetical protein BJX76DRAFT_342602 [Aspergillus varians]